MSIFSAACVVSSRTDGEASEVRFSFENHPKSPDGLFAVNKRLFSGGHTYAVIAFDKAEIGITGRLSIDTGTDYNELSNRPRTSLIFPVATQDLDRAFCVAQDVARRINQDGEFHREFLPPAKALRHASLARMQLNNMTRGLRMWMQPR
jgi:hypothetical protein